MAIFYQTSVDKEYIKVRWKEPYVSAALNRKIFGVVPKGVYSGFTIGPGGLSGRDIAVGPGSVSGGLGSGMQGGYVSGNYDESVGWSIAIHQNTSGYSSQIAIPPGGSQTIHLDATGTSGRVYIAIDVTYALTQETSASMQLVNSAQLNLNPSMIVLGFVDIPANPATPLDSSMFGYNDASYPRLTPLATAQKPGYMPTSVFAQLNQFFPWQNLLVMDRDPNNNYVVQISPSQGMASGKRIFTYILPSIASRFPRDSSGAYNGGINNDQLAKLNLQTGVISGAHQTVDNLSFSTPSVVGTPNSFQVGTVCLDATDRIYVFYGSVYASKAQALLDANLPIVSGKLFQVGNFTCETDGAGALLPLNIDAISWRRPFLNVGGGAGGDANDLGVRIRDQGIGSTYGYFSSCAFAVNEGTLVDSSSTGAYDLVNSIFKFSTSGQTFVSKQLLDGEFIGLGQDIAQLDLAAFWTLTNLDTAATYEISRDGGVNYQALTMVRNGTTDAYVGTVVFANEAVITNLENFPVSGANDIIPFDATSGITNSIGQQIIVSGAEVVTQLEMYATVSGAPAGSFVMQLVRDSSGQPSTSPVDVIAQTAPILISSLPAGNSVVTQSVSPTVLPAGTYWMVVVPDSIYRVSYVANVTQLAARASNAVHPIDAFGRTAGGTWAVYANHEMCYFLRGRKLDLRVRITSSTSSVWLQGFGVYYGAGGAVVNSPLEQQTISFSGDSNIYSFQVSNFLPNPKTLKIYWNTRVFTALNGDFSVNGQYVTFDPYTFYVPGTTQVITLDQSQGSAIDTSDANAANIAINTNRLDAIGQAIDDLKILDLSNKVSVPSTAIVNRAQIPDLSKDLSVNMGINRIMTQQIFQIQNESGANGEPVWGVVNDTLGQIRCVGNWVPIVNAYGQHIDSATENNYIEITFYGTGLNALVIAYSGGRDWRASVDGGSEGSNIWFSGISDPLGSRNYSSNTVVSLFSGLSPGVHTVKIRKNGASGGGEFFGFEIINESSSIKVNPGNYLVNGKKQSLALQQSIAYNSGFESGAFNTRSGYSTGGRVLVYLKADGTLGKALQPVTGTTPLYLTNASHSDEEIIKVHHWREFGSARGDDFSLLNTSSDRAFTLDDGTTTLVGRSVTGDLARNSVYLDTNNTSFIIFTFVGSGLDIINQVNTSGTESNVYPVYIDGTLQGYMNAGSTSQTKYKVCSGLPYGTHTVKISRLVPAIFSFGITSFVIYGPKKPTLPSGAAELADYYLMADYGGVPSGTAVDSITTGVLRKGNSREMVYVGTFSNTLDVNQVGGMYFNSTTLNDYVQYTFFGTGFEWHQLTPNFADNITFTIDGSTNFSVSNSSPVGGVGWVGALTLTRNTAFSSFTANPATATTSGTGVVNGAVSVTGLTLGVHTLKILHSTGSGHNFIAAAIDVITPIHSPKSNLLAELQNTLPIGSQSIGDLRKLNNNLTKQKVWAQSVGVVSRPTTNLTSATTPCPDLSTTIKLEQNGVLDISYSIEFYVSTTGRCGGQIYVDGIGYNLRRSAFITGESDVTFGDRQLIPVSAGMHKVDIHWWAVDGGTVTAAATYRTLIVREN